MNSPDLTRRFVEVELCPGVPFLLPGEVARERDEEARRRDLMLKAA